MKTYKTRPFAKWADNEGLSDQVLSDAISEIEKGLVEASLGGFLYKKRIPKDGQGKRGSYRTIIAFRSADRAFYIHGFDKGERANINHKEERALKKLAHAYMNFDAAALKRAVKAGALIEVITNEQNT